MMKKGQISVFIIIGLFVLAIAGFLIFLFPNIRIETRYTTINDLVIFVEDCIDSVTKFGLYKIGMQGGPIYLLNNFYDDGFFSIAYAYNEKKTFISLDEIERQLEFFINENLPACISDFAAFKERGFKIEYGKPIADATFARDDVFVELEFPLNITKGETSWKLEKFNANVPIKIKRIHSGIDAFVSDFEDRYNLSYLRELNSNVYIVPSDNTDLFVDESLDSRMFSENYLFLYVVR